MNNDADAVIAVTPIPPHPAIVNVSTTAASYACCCRSRWCLTHGGHRIRLMIALFWQKAHGLVSV